MNQGTALVVQTEVVDEYLGFEIHTTTEDVWYALPKSWNGEAEIFAPTKPALRKRIWSWWYCV